ncbi:MAG: nucleotidyltransferase family protein [Candidatus Omnitrophica bacterium]|nr:nucleotidyltransferase family protein [Candidatus Omnitrophota bacterium]
MALTVVLLAAGYATRLYPLTKDRPKALLPFGRATQGRAPAGQIPPRVILDDVCRSLKDLADVRTCVLVTNHRFAEQFRRWQQARRFPVRVLDDGTETAETRLGAIRDLDLARKLGQPQNDILVIGTDNLFTWSVADFVDQARRHAPHPSIALWEASSTDAATQFGVVQRDATSRIITFVEKSAQPPSKEVALCVYYFPAAMCGEIQRFLDEGGHADAPGYFIQWLVRQGIVYGIMMPGAWYDIGTVETYETVRGEWLHRTE